MAPNMNRHLDGAEVEALSMGATPEAECARIEEHLLVCPTCQQRVAESDLYVASIRMAARSIRSHSPRAASHAATAAGGRTAFWKVAKRAPGTVLALTIVAVLAAAALIVFPGSRPRSAVAVHLAATRGAVQMKAPAGHPLELECDLTGLPVWPAYRLEVVSNSGKRVRQVQITGPARIAGLSAGTYFVRIYAPTGDLLREYGLDITP